MKFRYFIILYGILLTMTNFTIRTDVNLVIVAMINSTDSINNSSTKNHLSLCGSADPPENKNIETNQFNTGKFNWNNHEKSLILGGFYWGYIFTQIPGALAGHYLSPKLSLTIGMFFFSFLDLFIPLFATFGYIYVFTIRLTQGLLQGFTVPVFNTLLGKWVPKFERTRSLAVFFSGNFIGLMSTQLIAGSISQPYAIITPEGIVYESNWPVVFYLFGSCGCFISLIAIFIIYDSPNQHPFISNKERTFINSSIFNQSKSEEKACINDENEHLNSIKRPNLRHLIFGLNQERFSDGNSNRNSLKKNVPWRKIFTSRAVYAIIVAHSCTNWMFYTIITYIPIYMYSVLGYDMKTVGRLSACCYIVQWPTTLIVSFFSDYTLKKKWLRLTSIRKINNTIGLFGSGVAILCVSLIECNRNAALFLFCLGMIFMSFVGSGYATNMVDISPKHAGVIFGISNTFATLPGFISPMVVSLFTSSEPSLANWGKVYKLASGIAFFGGTFYCLTASAEPQAWSVDNKQLELEEKLEQIPT